MTEKFTKGEMHGCIVCGKLYQLYVVNAITRRDPAQNPALDGDAIETVTITEK